MLFTEARFLAFFAVVFGVHWALRNHRARKLWLLVASYAFYAGWDWRFLGLIVFSTLVDFVAALRMRAEPGGSVRRRLWLSASLAANLGVLGLFKYWDFFLTSGVEFLAYLGLGIEPRTLSLVLPVGISFYTFQTMSYTIDAYRGRLEATEDLADFALFVAFFPQLVAGPIVRASTFLPQLKAARPFAEVAGRSCLLLFLFGYIKKACVADNIAAWVDPVFTDPAQAATSSLLLGAALYAIQIYCDFSGYSDMAIAAAGLLGYSLPLNFDAPYLATTMTDFWRRWHISLSSWFRDYLYLPLGGNRSGPTRTLVNLFLVFLLCGLWHGAGWNFVIWGLFHGLVLVVERLTRAREARRLGVLRWALTLGLATLAWIPFRAQSLADSGTYVAGLFRSGGAELIAPVSWILIVALLLLQLMLRRTNLAPRLAALPHPVFAVAYGAAVALTLPWVAASYEPFIYFQF